MKKIKILCKEIALKNGKGTFIAYKLIENNGKLVDLRFKRSVDTTIFKGLTKLEVEVEDINLNKNFEYPRYYVGIVNKESIKSLTE